MRTNRACSQFILLLCSGVLLLATSGCGASVDARSVQARADAPLPASVAAIKIAKDASQKDTVLVVQPVRVSERSAVDERRIRLKGSAQEMSGEAEVTIESSRYSNYLLQRQRQISLQFVSALSGVGNFRLIDHTAFSEDPKKAQEIAGGKGPYLVRAVITECTEAVLSEKRRAGLPLIYRKRNNLVEGIVGLDVSLVDAESGEVVKAFPVQGTFIAASAESGGGVVGRFSDSEVRMRSTIDQAIRVALNNAAATLHAELYANE